MKEILEKLQEKRQVEVAKSIVESAGYKVAKKSPRRKVKESIAFPGKDEVSYYTISIDAATNAPGTKYTDYPKRMSVGKNILKSAGISDSNIEVDQLGYDDISFIVKSSDRRYVDKLARKISAEAEEPSENSRLDYDQPEGAVVTIVGPYHNEDFDPDEDTDVWYH